MSGPPPSPRFRSPFAGKDLRGRDERPYHAPAGLLAAADAALVLGAPLLLTGEPGSGKTDFAFVAGNALGTEVLPCHVRSDTRARDLLYHFDALRRFADAQHGSEEDRRRAADPRNYVHLNGLGRGLLSPKRLVVLIDEVDKAPRDLPNDLLRELDRERGEFEIPEIDEDVAARLGEGPKVFGSPLQRVMRRDPKRAPMPFVVITSNAERQLPEPFLRRCVFYHIAFPDKEQLLTIARERNLRRDGDGRDPEPLLAANLLDPAVKIFRALRAAFALTKPPSTAELLTWIEVLGTVFEPRALGVQLREYAACFGDEDLKPLRAPRSWRQLPAVNCLLKLEEDLERLDRRVSPAS